MPWNREFATSPPNLEKHNEYLTTVGKKIDVRRAKAKDDGILELCACTVEVVVRMCVSDTTTSRLTRIRQWRDRLILILSKHPFTKCVCVSCEYQ